MEMCGRDERRSRHARVVMLMLALSLVLPSCMDLDMAEPLIEVPEPVLPAPETPLVTHDAGLAPGLGAKPEPEPAPEPSPDPGYDAGLDTDSSDLADAGSAPVPTESPVFESPRCVAVSVVDLESPFSLCWSGEHAYEPARTWWTTNATLL